MGTYGLGIFGRLVVDLSGCEVEISVLLRANNNDMSVVCLWGNAFDGGTEFASLNDKGLLWEAIVN